MPTWRSALLGLGAWNCRAGSEDLHLSDHAGRFSPAFSPATVVWGEDDGGRQLVESEFTDACSNLPKRSLKACDRCLSNEMCPFNSSTNTAYICSPMTKRCADPSWNGTEIQSICGENLADYTSWGAMCMLICSDQRAPFNCATKCLNEDFPCNWVKDCHADSGNMKGMTADSAACLRPCQDHDAMLQVELKTIKSMATHIDTCSQAASYYGCSNKWGAMILELCPQTCRTGECQWRCGREELPTTDGKQCWQVVERTIDQYTCARAISEGMDCHCKCAHAYLMMSRAGGGSFRGDMVFGDDPVGFNKTVSANKTFDVSLAGQAMRTEKVDDAWGPRLKIVFKGQDCKYARLIAGFSGIQCIAPPTGSASATTASTCITPPSLFSPYMHRWTNLKIDQCGEFDVCHCNTQCDLTRSWSKAGTVTVAPPVEVGSISKALPGCARPIPAVSVLKGPAGEVQLKTVTSITMTVFGGIKEEHKKFALHASKQALVSVLKAYSGLLKKEVPTSNDIVVAYARRLQVDDFSPDIVEPVGYSYNEFLSKNPRRLAESCADNNTAFEAEAAKVGVFLGTCTQALQTEPGMCAEASLQAAVKAGCQRACALCPELSTIITTQAPTMAPDVKALPSMSFNFKISGHTDYSAASILARCNLLKKDPVPYVQRLFLELENAKVPVADIPSRLWATIVNGPNQTVIPEDETTDAEDNSDDTTSILIVVLGGGLGGACAFGMCVVCVGYICTRGDKKRKVVPEVKEVTQVSEGGYRLKKSQVEQELGEQPPDLDCLERCCVRCFSTHMRCFLRCHKRFCKKKLRKAKAWSEAPERCVPANPSELQKGVTVKLFGLSSAHYNGLTGTVISGPNEKGRFEVDLLVVDDHSLEEHQTLSFKPANMKIIYDEPDIEVSSPVTSPVAKPDVNPLNGLKTSYRTAKPPPPPPPS